MKQESRIKVFISSFLILYSVFIYSQDSVSASLGVNEKNNIKFQNNFFNALSQKAILNYKKAIEYLDNCNQLVPNNKSVLFELSKNYLKLNRNGEALEYIELALNKEPHNLWLLEHKVIILKKFFRFDEAILTQKKIIEKYPKKKRPLIFLHLQNKDITAAKEVLSELENDKLLNSRLRRIQEKLNNTKKEVKKHKKNVVNTNLKDVFEIKKTYNNLKALLEELTLNNDVDLLKYSEQGLTLFPAQPLVYLMNGKALNRINQHKKALESLQNGIDFVIDNNQIEANFYLEMAVAYEGLNNVVKAKSFKSKASKILK